ncbi:MAG: hypothetical protein LBP37_06025 [Spirochaetaceae bacterium]|jgi:hypothetical protein|nr:hypothetical protein [Spirochaetaceae bacterium]
MEKCRRLILIGSTGRNSGKTFLAAELIRRFSPVPVTALKITGIERHGGPCPRGGQGCGACAISGDFCLEEELSPNGTKDTSVLLAAGAKKVFWLRCLHSALARGFAAFLNQAGGESIGDGIIICESNSLREVLEPAAFIMINDAEGSPPKPSAQRNAGKSDFTLQSPVSANDVTSLLQALSKKGFPASSCLS